MRDRIVRGILLVTACICLAACCGVNRDRQSTDTGEITRWSVGLFFSPYVEFVHAPQIVDGKLVGMRQSGRFVLNSWSFAALVAGVLLLCWRQRLGVIPIGRADIGERVSPV